MVTVVIFYQEIDWSRDDVCTVCRGTEWSGESLLCDDCNFRYQL